MPGLEDIKPLSRYFGLWVGASGAGKDCAAASFPGPIYVFDLDGRVEGMIAAQEWLGKINVTFDRYQGYKGVEEKLKSFVATYNATRKFPYKTIVFDSITAGSRLYVQEAVEMGVKGDTSDSGTPRRLGTINIPGFNAYNYESIAHYNVILAYLKVMPCNVIITGHMADRFNKKGENIGMGLLGRPKLAEEIPSNFNEVLEFERDYNEIKQTNTFYVRFKGELAKTVLPKAPNGRIDITKKNFFELLKTYADVPNLGE